MPFQKNMYSAHSGRRAFRAAVGVPGLAIWAVSAWYPDKFIGTRAWQTTWTSLTGKTLVHTERGSRLTEISAHDFGGATAIAY